MNAPAIILGETEGILRLPKAPLLNRGNWTQQTSDVLAHLIQVQSQIQESRWNISKIQFTSQDGLLLDHSFPEFEDFVFAAVYFRQLFGNRDKLLKDAVDRYCQFVDCQIRRGWVRHEFAAFDGILDNGSFTLPDFTVRELFDAFMYGAGLLHKIPTSGEKNRQRFLEICNDHPRHKVLYALNMSLKLLMNHVGRITLVMHRDFSYWLDEYGLPLPDTRWHKSLFKVKVGPPSNDAIPGGRDSDT